MEALNWRNYENGTMVISGVSLSLGRQLQGRDEAEHSVLALRRSQLPLSGLLREQGRPYAEPRPAGLTGHALRPDVRHVPAVCPVPGITDDGSFGGSCSDGSVHVA